MTTLNNKNHAHKNSSLNPVPFMFGLVSRVTFPLFTLQFRTQRFRKTLPLGPDSWWVRTIWEMRLSCLRSKETMVVRLGKKLTFALISVKWMALLYIKVKGVSWLAGLLPEPSPPHSMHSNSIHVHQFSKLTTGQEGPTFSWEAPWGLLPQMGLFNVSFFIMMAFCPKTFLSLFQLGFVYGAKGIRKKKITPKTNSSFASGQEILILLTLFSPSSCKTMHTCVI